MSTQTYPPTVSPNYHIWPKSPYIVVLLHGQNPLGHRYCEESFFNMTTILNVLKISNILYFRSYTYTADLLPFDEVTEDINGVKCQKTELYDPETEFMYLNVELKKIEIEHNIQNPKYILVGHSLGGLYAAIMGDMFGGRCIKTISLDGFNFYEVLPFFMSHRAGMSVDESKITYRSTEMLYDGEPFDLRRIAVSQKLYEMAYAYRDVHIPNHYLIDYFNNNSDPFTTVVSRMDPDPHYPKKWSIRYGEDYDHSIHSYFPVARIIVEQFIAKDKK